MKRIALLVLVLGLLVVPGVAAQNTNTTSERQEITNRIDQRRNERVEKLQERDAKKCELVKARLEAQQAKSEELFELRTARYQNIIDRLNALVLRLENNDLEASELEEVVTNASDLVSEMETTYGQYTAELRNAVNLSCVDDVDFRDTLQTARSALRTARQDDREIREYLREEARTVIEALVESNNNAATTPNNEDSDAQDADDNTSNNDENREG